MLLTACSGSAPPPASVEGKVVHPSSGPTVEASGRPCSHYTLIGQVRVPVAAARIKPDRSARIAGRFPRVNQQGAVQVFPLLEEATHAGHVWYRAMLPIRPNGITGWILDRDVRLQRSDYHLEVDLERFRLHVFHLCREIATYPVGVGDGETPTPKGTFFLNSLLKPPDPGTVYGAFAFGLSGYSDVIHDWTWGGVVGLHGTNDPSSIGHAVSHGCIRLRNADIRVLARMLPLGTLIRIR